MTNATFEYGAEYWTATSGDLIQRRERINTPQVVDSAAGATEVVIDPTEEYQLWVQYLQLLQQ